MPLFNSVCLQNRSCGEAFGMLALHAKLGTAGHLYKQLFEAVMHNVLHTQIETTVYSLHASQTSLH